MHRVTSAPVRARRPFSVGPRTGVVAAACLALAGLSLLIPSAPTTDPWGWIVWGREILRLDLSTVVPGAPSWKPLPVLVTTPLALVGGATSSLWLLVARAGGLAGLVMAYRLGRRFAGIWAGLLAPAGLVLSTDWLRAFAHGYSEPLAIGLLLAAVDRHLSSRPRQALLLGALVALARPEAWCLLGAYGLLLWRRKQAEPLLVLALIVLVPALWLVPDWIGSGDPFHAGKVSRSVEPIGAAATLRALGQGALIAPLPLSLTALAGTVLALRRGERELPLLTALALAWAALLTLLMLADYPAAPRFFALPAGLLCVVGAAGAVFLVEASGGRSARIAVGVGLALLALPPVTLRALGTAREASDTIARAELESDLRTAVERARAPLRRCGTPVLPSGLAWTKGVVAWTLDLPLRRVRGVRTSATGYVEALSNPHDDPLGSKPSGGSVTVRPRRNAFVLLAPFGDARVRLAGRPRARLVTVAAAGRWRVEGAGGCLRRSLVAG